MKSKHRRDNTKLLWDHRQVSLHSGTKGSQDTREKITIWYYSFPALFLQSIIYTEKCTW